MVRTELKLPEVAIHILLADVNVGARDRVFEQVPKALDAIGVMPSAGLEISPSPLLSAMIHGTVCVAVLAE